MRYYFSDFSFDSVHLNLYKDDQPLPIRPKIAEMLSLFLSDPDRVFSKEDIFTLVWQDRVVSEQGIFQTISELRSIFGDTAIKTFPKKGYQWQISLEEKPVAENKEESKKPRNKYALVAIIISIIALVFSLVIGISQKINAHSDTRGAYLVKVLPFSLVENEEAVVGVPALDAAVSDGLDKQVHMSSAISRSPIRFHELVTRPGLGLQLFEDESTDFVLSGVVRRVNDKYVLRYRLSSQHNIWLNELAPKDSLEEVASALVAGVGRIAPAKIFHAAELDVRLVNAQLQILHSEIPDDPGILNQLILSAFNLGDLDQVYVLAEKLNETSLKAEHLTYQGVSWLKRAYVSLEREDYTNTDAFLDRARTIFIAQNDFERQSELALLESLKYRRQGNFIASKDMLVDAALFAKRAHLTTNQVYIELRLAEYLDDMGEIEARNKVLRNVELLLGEYGLPKEHYSALYVLRAKLADDEKIAETYYKRVLQLLSSNEVWQEHLQAQRGLSNLYIKQKRWHEALDLFASKVSLTNQEMVVLSDIHLSKGDHKDASNLAAKVFKDAKLKGDIYLALDAALVLFQASEKLNLSEKRLYRKFINEKATEFWLTKNQEKLDALNIFQRNLARY